MVCLFVVFSGNSSAQTANTDSAVFEHVLDLQPGIDNPRNSEGAFLKLKNGRLLFVYSHYTGNSSSDHANAYLASRYSEDGGKSWSNKDEKVIDQEGQMNIMSVSLLRLKNGRIALFYLRKNSLEDCMPVVRFSNDEGKSWSQPINCITDRKGYFVLNNDRVIQLKSGRLLMPLALHQEFGTGKWHNEGSIFCYFSDDNGISWQVGAQIPNLANLITQEPGVVELLDGRVWMFIRTASGTQYQSFSSDKGNTWSPIEPTIFHSPLSPASIKRIPVSNELIIVWNNNDGKLQNLKGKRTPLTIAVSKDDGKTWQCFNNIESDPDGWYCYIAIEFIENQVLLAYCAGSQSQKTHLSRTVITRVNLNRINCLFK